MARAPDARVLVMTALLLAGNAMARLAQAITIELKDVAPDRIERQRQAAYGDLPLPGTPDTAKLADRLASKGLAAGSAVFIRIFKAESELELWLRKDDRFVLLDTYPICHWSGTLGPKIKEGDKQNPEGFYKVRRRQLHLAGRWPRSLNLGFPNPYDRALSRTGSYILLHGGCSSTGCFAMTNSVMQEIFGLTEKALRGGQEYVNIHVFPFRMTEENLKRNESSEWRGFWQTLKDGYDAFEATHLPPRVGVCGKQYVVQQAGPDDPPGEVSQPGSRRVRFTAARDFACPAEAASLGPGDPSETASDLVREPGRTGTRRMRHRPHRRQSDAAQNAAGGFDDAVFRRE